MLLAILFSLPDTGAAPGQNARGGEVRYSTAFDACINSGDAARGVMSAMTSCFGLEAGRQDAALNRSYRAALARLPAPSRARLRGSERAWIRLRNRKCDAARAKAGGGSLAGIEYQGCLVTETIKRTDWLDRQR